MCANGHSKKETDGNLHELNYEVGGALGVEKLCHCM